MNPIAVPNRLAEIYPTATIRGRRMTRLPEMLLEERVRLDATMAEMLGREQLGWFVGNHPGLSRAAEQFYQLDSTAKGGVWIVVPCSRLLSYELFSGWPRAAQVVEAPTSNSAVWRSQRVWVAIPEDLRHLLPVARSVNPGVAGVIILDPQCIIYKARAGTDSRGHVHRNDRPQHVVNFRAALDREGWQPPLLLLTRQPPKSVCTQDVARAFCLHGFHFIAGDWFACWNESIEEE